MDIFLRKVLEGHTESVNAVDFDEKYIVSGSGDKTIKVGRERRGRGRKGRRKQRRMGDYWEERDKGESI